MVTSRGSVKAIWTSHPDNGARVARTLGAKSHGPGAAPRTSMPMVAHPARSGANGNRGTGSLHSCQATAAFPMPPAASTARQWRKAPITFRCPPPPWRPAPIPAETQSHLGRLYFFPLAPANQGQGRPAPIPPTTQGGALQLCGRMKICGGRQWNSFSRLLRNDLFGTPIHGRAQHPRARTPILRGF